jgi:hypothetical protein
MLSREEQAKAFNALPIDVQQAVERAVQGAQLSAMQATLWGVAGVALLGLLVSAFLPKTKATSRDRSNV